MTRGALVGCTDYSHQMLSDVVGDLNAEAKLVGEILAQIDANIAALRESGYWQSHVSHDFEMATLYALRHYRTAKAEMAEISNEIRREVQAHHCARLRTVAAVAKEIHGNIGIAWHQHYDKKEYGVDSFQMVERVYCDIRDIAGNLIDVANMAIRLEDFVGKGQSSHGRANPWIAGTFYLFAVLVLLVLIAVLSSQVSWVLLPVILIGSTLILGVVGAFQLRNDDKLSESNFVQLVVETYKRLPLLRRH